MSVKIRGMDKVTKELEQRLGKKAMEPVIDEALNAGADVFIKELKREFESFKDTGATIEEIEKTAPYYKNGDRTITIRWRGPKERYRIIHLNEWGTIKNPNPRGKGAVARTMQSAKKAYRKALTDAIKRRFK